MLRAQIDTGHFSTATHPRVANVIGTVVHDAQAGEVNAFALNRSREEVQLELELRGLGERTVSFARELHHADIKGDEGDGRDEGDVG